MGDYMKSIKVLVKYGKSVENNRDKNYSGLEQWQVSNNKVLTIHRSEVLDQFSKINTK